jgi:NADPH-dependent F420 reductase
MRLANREGKLLNESISIVGGTHGLGYGLALRLAKAGRKVVIGSRKKSKAEKISQGIVEKLGEVSVKGFENPKAVAKGEIVIVAVPFEAQEETAIQIRDDLKPGCIVVDAAVPLTRTGKFFGILERLKTSSAERLRELLPENVKVVSAFKNVSAAALEQIDRKLECDIIVCGDYEEAKKEIFELVKDIEGARPIDGGPLRNSRMVESLVALLINLNIIYRSNQAGVRITGITV